jgi:hypothetical protein
MHRPSTGQTHPSQARRWADQFISVFEGSVLLARAKADPSVIEKNLRVYARSLARAFTMA